MNEIIDRIAVLFGVGRERDQKVSRVKPRKREQVRRENDSITISAEARRLLAKEEKDEAPRHDGRSG